MGKDGKKKSKRESKSRDDDGGAEPQGTVAVSVKVVRENSNTSGSVLACFTDAPAPGDLLDQDAEPYEFQCEQAGGARALTGQKGRTILEGKQSSAKCCYRYLVGVYDPDKGRLEVVDPGGAAATANLFSLQRRLRGDALEGGVSKLSKEEAREALVDGFGSKRVKATHKKRKGQQLEEEGSEAMESLEKTLRVRKQEADAVKATTGVDEEVAKDGGPNELAPSPNLAATAVSGIYTRQSLLNDECWEAINPGSMIGMAENASKDRSTLPDFVVHNLSHVAAAGEDKKTKKYLAKLLTLVTYLVRFHLLPSRFKHTTDTLKKELGIPLPLGVYFLDTFAEQGASEGSHSKPQVHKDRLLLALAVSSLLACGFDMEIDALALDLKMHADKVAAYFKEVGAKLNKISKKVKMEDGGSVQVNTHRCTLALPLTFPKRSRGPR